MFYAYLLLEHDFHIKKYDYNSFGGVNEYLFRFKPEKQSVILNDMNLHWSSTREGIVENTVMLFHLDREEFFEFYFSDKIKKRM